MGNETFVTNFVESVYRACDLENNPNRKQSFTTSKLRPFNEQFLSAVQKEFFEKYSIVVKRVGSRPFPTQNITLTFSK